MMRMIARLLSLTMVLLLVFPVTCLAADIYRICTRDQAYEFSARLYLTVAQNLPVGLSERVEDAAFDSLADKIVQYAPSVSTPVRVQTRNALRYLLLTTAAGESIDQSVLDHLVFKIFLRRYPQRSQDEEFLPQHNPTREESGGPGI